MLIRRVMTKIVLSLTDSRKLWFLFVAGANVVDSKDKTTMTTMRETRNIIQTCGFFFCNLRVSYIYFLTQVTPPWLGLPLIGKVYKVPIEDSFLLDTVPKAYTVLPCSPQQSPWYAAVLPWWNIPKWIHLHPGVTCILKFWVRRHFLKAKYPLQQLINASLSETTSSGYRRVDYDEMVSLKRWIRTHTFSLFMSGDEVGGVGMVTDY